MGLPSLPAAAQQAAVPNRAPLHPAPFIPLELGQVKARGWLAAQLELQAAGLTGHAEQVIPELGPDSAWRGGRGESWEKGPYYVKGLVSLAYVLDDLKLRQQAQKWIDWTLASQRPDGQLGPASNDDWWPRMVITWALRDYYEATRDPRALAALTKYARYLQQNLPKRPLQEWGKARAGDQISTFYWLYNRTGEPFLLEAAAMLESQANDWKPFFRTLRGKPEDFFIAHGVNVSQAMKFPLMVYARTGDAGDRAVFAEGWARLQQRHGLVTGLWSGTEVLASRSTTQGVEMCTIVEQMLSHEEAIAILGEPVLGDQLERIAFNLLPGGITKDFKQYQYYTLANQPVARKGDAGYAQDHGDDLVPGPHSGFHCCCYNLHMGWPKYVQHAWMATAEGGLAAVAYGPSEVALKIGDTPVQVIEETDYPFADGLKFTVKPARPVAFPLKLRIPGWSVGPAVQVNGQPVAGVTAGEFLVLDRTWQAGDTVTASFPADLAVANGIHGSAAIWRGPLVFSLRIREQRTATDQAPDGFNEFTLEPASPWNYALDLDRKDPAAALQLSRTAMPANPWLPETTPIRLTASARRLPGWGLTRHDLLAAEVPASPVTSAEPLEQVTLVPFGAQSLRITAFPLLRGEEVPEPGMLASHENPGDLAEAVLTNPVPTSSHGPDLPRFTWWDHRGTAEWLQWTFERPATVSTLSVYWFDDTGSGRCRVPASWRLLYRSGGEWRPVGNPSSYGVAKDQPNVVTFDPVETSALKIEVQLQDGFSGGVLRLEQRP